MTTPTTDNPQLTTTWYCDGCKTTHTHKTERIQAGDKSYCPAAWRKLRSIFKPLKRK